MAHSVKCLVCKHDDLILDPPGFMKKSGAVLCTCNPSVEGVETGGCLDARRTAYIAQSGSYRFSEKLSQKKAKRNLGRYWMSVYSLHAPSIPIH